MSFVPAASREEQTAPKVSLDSFLAVEVASCTHNDPTAATAAAAAVESSPSRGCIVPSASRAMIESASKYPPLLIMSHCFTHRVEKCRSRQPAGNGLRRFEFVFAQMRTYRQCWDAVPLFIHSSSFVQLCYLPNGCSLPPGMSSINSNLLLCSTVKLAESLVPEIN